MQIIQPTVDKYILITGVSGFLGSHVFKYMMNNVNYKIIGLKRKTSNLSRLPNMSNNAFLINLDENYSNIDDIFSKYNIEAIIHCATNYGRSNESCLSVIDSNLIFPIKLIESAIKYNSKLFINTDSYFNKACFSYKYLHDYSLSKKSLNLWLKYFSNKIKIANIILEHIYGEFDSLNKFTSFLVSEIAIKNSQIIDLTYGDQKRDFIYVKDVVKAYDKVLDFCMNNKIKYREFELGTGESVSIKEFASVVKTVSNSNTKLNFGAIPYREDEIFISEAENSALLNIGWFPKYTYKEGIKEYINNEKIINSNTHI